MYPLIIFILFIITKLINHKLHILFDGEELLEEDKNKEGDSPEKEKSNVQTQENDNKDSEIEVDKESGDPKVEEDNFMTMLETPEALEAFFNNGENQAISTEAIQIHTENGDSLDKSSLQQSNTELVTSSPTHSPVERAVVVDLHSTKVDFKEKTGEIFLPTVFLGLLSLSIF